MAPISYARHRFPPDVIRHAVWLYLRFTLSYRDVEELMAKKWPGCFVRDAPAMGPEIRVVVRSQPARLSSGGCSLHLVMDRPDVITRGSLIRQNV
jgi:hypothetical protein